MIIKNILHSINFYHVLILIFICAGLTFSCKSIDLDKKSKSIASKNNSYNDNDDEDNDDNDSKNSDSNSSDSDSTADDAVCYDPKGSVDSDICEVEALIIKQLNEFRSSKNLSTLQNNKALSCAARTHSKDQAQRGTIGHWGFSGSRTSQLKTCASDSSSVSYLTAENVAMYPSSSSNESLATNFMNMWKNSWGHRVNMLNSNSTYIGVGVAKSGSYYYATQVFGR